jgi:LmbE family N-acetylglucosaminyl deacetylase
MINKNDLGIIEPYALMLAHGDDEIGAIPIVLKNPPVLVIYLTNGCGIGEIDLSEKRECEIKRSWRILNSDSEVINFGSDFEIPDGALHSSLTVAHLEILEKLLADSGAKFILTTHAEGGHQDHDTTFIVSQYISLKLEVGLFSFPLYCQSTFSKKLFRVMSSHGLGIKNEIKDIQMRVRSFVTAIQLIFNYRSQWKTWIGLSLPLLFAMIRKYQFLEPTYVSLNNYPEANILFYVSRGRADRASVTSHWSKIGIISNKHL